MSKNAIELSQDKIEEFEKKENVKFARRSGHGNYIFENNLGEEIVHDGRKIISDRRGTARKSEKKRIEKAERAESFLNMLNRYYPEYAFRLLSFGQNKAQYQDCDGDIWVFQYRQQTFENIASPCEKPNGKASIEERQREVLADAVEKICLLMKNLKGCIACKYQKSVKKEGFQITVCLLGENKKIFAPYKTEPSLLPAPDELFACEGGIFHPSDDQLLKEAKRVFSSIWSGSEVRTTNTKVLSAASRMAEKLVKTHNINSEKFQGAPLYFGDIKILKYREDLIECYLKRDGSITIKTPAYSFEMTENYKYKKNTFKTTVGVALEDKEACNLFAKQYAHARKKVEATGIELKYRSGAGLLLGNTRVCAALKKSKFGSSRSTTIKLPACEKSDLEAWKSEFDTALAEVISDAEKNLREEEEGMSRQLSYLVENPLKQDIFEVICANEKYITANAVVQILRRVAVQLNKKLEVPKYIFDYNLLDADYIKGVINEMVRKNVLYEISLKGTYGRFDILRPTHSKLQSYSQDAKPAVPGIKSVQAELKAGKKLSYRQLEAYLPYIQAHHKTAASMMNAIQFLHNPVFVAIYKESLIEMFADFSEEVLAYFEIELEMNPEKFSKAAVKLIKAAKKEVKKKVKKKVKEEACAASIQEAE